MRMPFKKKMILSSLIASVLLSTGCSVNISKDAMESDAKQAADKPIESKDQGVTKLELNGQSLRIQSIENSYYALSFQQTVFNSYKDILASINPMSNTLDEIFNFKQLMYGQKMLPPVIEESYDYLGVQSEKSMVKTERRWKIIKDAKVVATTPVWQDYLFAGMSVKPNTINSTLTPITPEEIKAAQKGKQRGVREGKEYVVQLFNTNLSRLSKDFLGMLTYKKLEVQGIVGAPILAISNEPFIYGNSNKEVSVGTQRYLITQDSSFKSYKNWKPIVSTGQANNEPDNAFNPPVYKRK